MKHLKSAFQHMRRAPYQSVAATIIMSITFFVATLFILVAFFSSSLLAYFESQPQITVFFEDSKTQNEIEDLQSRLQSTGKIESLRYISKEEALEIYRKDHKDDPLLLEMVTAEILPASLEIRTTEVEYLDQIAALMQKEEGVEDTIYQKDIVDKLISWTRSVRAMGVLFLGLLTLETLLIILTIVGMRIVNKRREIVILQLLGASTWYIRLPFLLEGAIYGIFGGLLGWLLSYGVLLYQAPFLASLLSGLGSLTLPFLPNFTVWPISFSLMLLVLTGVSFTGFLLGVVGSFLAVHRYLR